MVVVTTTSPPESAVVEDWHVPVPCICRRHTDRNCAQVSFRSWRTMGLSRKLRFTPIDGKFNGQDEVLECFFYRICVFFRSWSKSRWRNWMVRLYPLWQLRVFWGLGHDFSSKSITLCSPGADHSGGLRVSKQPSLGTCPNFFFPNLRCFLGSYQNPACGCCGRGRGQTFPSSPSLRSLHPLPRLTGSCAWPVRNLWTDTHWKKADGPGRERELGSIHRCAPYISG